MRLRLSETANGIGPKSISSLQVLLLSVGLPLELEGIREEDRVRLQDPCTHKMSPEKIGKLRVSKLRVS